MATSPLGVIPKPMTMESLELKPMSFAGMPHPKTFVTIPMSVSARRNHRILSSIALKSTSTPKDTKKMDAKMKNRLDAYLELLEEISEKTNDESTAVALLQEISKDRRMEKIREEKDSNNGDQPATDKQRKFMSDLNIEFTDDITKKQASFLIDTELGKTDAD